LTSPQTTQRQCTLAGGAVLDGIIAVAVASSARCVPQELQNRSTVAFSTLHREQTQ
jgi:hypothetical protein